MLPTMLAWSEKTMIVLKKFAEERQVQPDAVTMYIRRHKKEFEGETKKEGNKLLLSETAVEKLDKIYPLPRPIEIIQDTESREKLLKAQEYIIQLQAKINEQALQIAEATNVKLLLEDKTSQLKDAKEENNILKEQNDRLQEKYETELRKTWWDKLRGK